MLVESLRGFANQRQNLAAKSSADHLAGLRITKRCTRVAVSLIFEHLPNGGDRVTANVMRSNDWRGPLNDVDPLLPAPQR